MACSHPAEPGKDVTVPQPQAVVALSDLFLCHKPILQLISDIAPNTTKKKAILLRSCAVAHPTQVLLHPSESVKTLLRNNSVNTSLPRIGSMARSSAVVPLPSYEPFDRFNPDSFLQVLHMLLLPPDKLGPCLIIILNITWRHCSTIQEQTLN